MERCDFCHSRRYRHLPPVQIEIIPGSNYHTVIVNGRKRMVDPDYLGEYLARAVYYLTQDETTR
ncbi:hypothetical protein [Thermosynechococcus sp. FA-CM-4201]